jgi:D-aspartate ligase
LIKQIFILGNHIQALGIARQVKGMGIGVCLFTSDKLSITRFSNAVDKTVIFTAHNDLLLKIEDSRVNERSVLLFPTNDNMVDFLSANYKMLKKDFYLGIPAPETVEIFYNKRNTYLFAKKYGIPAPESWFPNSMADLTALAPKLTYPVIIKPAIMHTFHKTFGKKAFKCNSPDELIAKAVTITVSFPIEHLLIQEFLSGGAKTLYSYGAFAANGKVMAALMANRIRQNPMDFGNSTTFAITCNIPEVRKHAEKILKVTNYSGLAEVEFMFDEKSGQYKFLEINTRAWKWHSISNGIGFSFIGKFIQYLNEDNQSIVKDFDSETAWVERLTDFAVIIKEIINKRMKFTDVIKSYKVRKTYAVWSKKDMLPFVAYLLFSPYLFLKRH